MHLNWVLVASKMQSLRNVNSKQKIAVLKEPFFNLNIPISISFSSDSQRIATAGYQDDTI